MGVDRHPAGDDRRWHVCPGRSLSPPVVLEFIKDSDMAAVREFRVCGHAHTYKELVFGYLARLYQGEQMDSNPGSLFSISRTPTSNINIPSRVPTFSSRLSRHVHFSVCVYYRIPRVWNRRRSVSKILSSSSWRRRVVRTRTKRAKPSRSSERSPSISVAS